MGQQHEGLGVWGTGRSQQGLRGHSEQKGRKEEGEGGGGGGGGWGGGGPPKRDYPGGRGKFPAPGG